MHFSRKSGILLPVTSLPSRYGIGDLGQGAFDFVDFLKESGQGIWQILPIGPPALGNSPYSCYSAFAGNSLLISLEQLVRDGWVEASVLSSQSAASASESSVDYDAVAASKRPLLRQAFVQSQPQLHANADFQSFCRENAFWLTGLRAVRGDDAAF